MKNVFFSQNLKTAKKRISELAKEDAYYKNKTAVLANKQIQHVAGWKTYEIATNLPPIRLLICGCCSMYTKGRQYWNQDIGYGLCKTCSDWYDEKGREAERNDYYGTKGIHYCLEEVVSNG